jgi:4-hydroxy-tetrahydrodipicolinate synthase
MQGVLAPVLTPFDSDLNPDPALLLRHCRSLLEEGLTALSPFGTTSEANSLSVEEREALLAALVEGGVPAARLVPGTGCSALSDTVRLTRAAVRAGCAGVLMLPPFYYKNVSEEGSIAASPAPSIAWARGACACTSTISRRCPRWASRCA